MVRVQEEEQKGHHNRVAFFLYNPISYSMYYVYILYSKSHDRYYVGQTNDVERRLIEHNENPRMTYTHKFRPWELVRQYEVDTRSNAMKLERYIKKMKSRKIIERLIIDGMYFDEIAQLVGVPMHRN